jgi:DNA-binding transcriptional ArsR family regulator
MTQEPPEPVAVRTVDDAATLKAMSDPLRLAILRVFMADANRVLSVKELAAELGEAQTRLYRHVNHLEERGLLLVAETRVVSGIIEQRYRAGQRSLMLDRDLLATSASRDDVATTLTAAFDHTRDHLTGEFHAGRVRFHGDRAEAATHPEPLLAQVNARLGPAAYQRLRDQIREVVRTIDEAEEDPAGVEVNLFAVLYASEPTGDSAGTAPAASPAPGTTTPR